MANLRTAMDSAFWDLNVSSPHTLEGSAKAIPGDPFPLDGARASRVLRIQQLSLLGNGFPLGIIPSYSPTSHKDLGSFSLQSLLLRPATSNWYTAIHALLISWILFFVFSVILFRFVCFLGWVCGLYGWWKNVRKLKSPFNGLVIHWFCSWLVWLLTSVAKKALKIWVLELN